MPLSFLSRALLAGVAAAAIAQVTSGGGGGGDSTPPLWNVAAPPSGVSFSNGNATWVTSTTGYNQQRIASIPFSGGKKCVKLTYSGTLDDIAVGISQAGFNANTAPGDESISWGYHTGGGATGGLFNNGSTVNWPYGAAIPHTSEIIIGFDTATNTLEIFKDGVSVITQVVASGTWYASAGSYNNQPISIGVPTSLPTGYTALMVPPVVIDPPTMVNPAFTLIPSQFQALMPSYRGAPTSGAKVTFLDTSGGSDTNDGASDATPLLTWAAAMSRVASLSPGATLLLKKGTTIVGPIEVNNISGALGNPNYLSTYGTGAAPQITNIHGYLDRAAPLYETNGLTFNYGSAYWIIDGREQGGLVVTDCREAGIKLESYSPENSAGTGFEFYNIESYHVSMGIAADKGSCIIERCYFHDGTMSVDTNDGPPPGADDDYGANGIRLHSIGRKQVRFNYAIRLRAASPDYGQDGGFVELAGTSGIGEGSDDVEIAYNLVVDTEGFCEAGGDGVYEGGVPKTTHENVLVHHNIIKNCGWFMSIHSGGAFGATFTNCSAYNNTIIQTAQSSHVAAGVSNYTVMNAADDASITHYNNLYYVNQSSPQDVLSAYDANMTPSGNWRHDNAYYVPAAGDYTIPNTGGLTGFHLFNTYDETLKTGEVRHLPSDPCFTDLAGGDYSIASGSAIHGAGIGAI